MILNDPSSAMIDNCYHESGLEQLSLGFSGLLLLLSGYVLVLDLDQGDLGHQVDQ